MARDEKNNFVSKIYNEIQEIMILFFLSDLGYGKMATKQTFTFTFELKKVLKMLGQDFRIVFFWFGLKKTNSDSYQLDILDYHYKKCFINCF